MPARLRLVEQRLADRPVRLGQQPADGLAPASQSGPSRSGPRWPTAWSSRLVVSTSTMPSW